MAVRKNSTKPIDQSEFLWALKCNLSNTRVVLFDLNSQQGVSIAASSLISNTKRTTVFCNTCLYSTDIQTSLYQFLSHEILSSQNKWSGPSFKTLSDSTREICVTNSASILAIQLCSL